MQGYEQHGIEQHTFASLRNARIYACYTCFACLDYYSDGWTEATNVIICVHCLLTPKSNRTQEKKKRKVYLIGIIKRDE